MITQAFHGQSISSSAATQHPTPIALIAEDIVMLKCALRALLLPLLLLLPLSPLQAAGTIAYSLSQQLDKSGKVLTGCKLYTIVAGTTSAPQNAYKDTALTLPHTNPIVCDAAGRLPQFFLADGQIKIRLEDKNGVVQVSADNILVIGPSSGGGGGGSIDPTTIAATGDLKTSYGTQPLTGWVRLNGRTLGSATSGATERANADTQALFQYLWGADTNLAVSGGRGGSAAADWAANKTIALPDGRGRAVAGLDDMGNAAAGRLTATYFGTAATVLGAAGGAESRVLVTANLPPYTPAGSVATSTVIPYSLSGAGGLNNQYAAGNGSSASFPFTGGSTFTGTAQGGTSTPHAIASPMLLATIYIKL